MQFCLERKVCIERQLRALGLDRAIGIESCGTLGLGRLGFDRNLGVDCLDNLLARHRCFGPQRSESIEAEGTGPERERAR